MLSTTTQPAKANAKVTSEPQADKASKQEQTQGNDRTEDRDVIQFLQSISKRLKGFNSSGNARTSGTMAEEIDDYIAKFSAGEVQGYKTAPDADGKTRAVRA